MWDSALPIRNRLLPGLHLDAVRVSANYIRSFRFYYPEFFIWIERSCALQPCFCVTHYKRLFVLPKGLGCKYDLRA
jgi:hypothetical protein